MEPIHAAAALQELAGSPIAYLRCYPEVPDFTAKESCKLIVIAPGKKAEIDLTHKNCAVVARLVQDGVFTIPAILTWNIKPLFTYLRFYLGKNIEIGKNLYDLKVMEAYRGISENAPENLTEAVNRFKEIASSQGLKKVYSNLHLPLIARTLPSIETVPVLDESDKHAKYAYYEVEGQRNGRLKCYGKFAKSYVPHTMGADKRSLYKPRGREFFFIEADINHCEPQVLAYLSRDPVLLDIMESKKDIHSTIYEIVTGDVCDTDIKRKKSKELFLPVVYGAEPWGIQANLGVSEAVAKELINRVQANFKTALDYVASFQEQAEQQGYAEDSLGRRRYFEEKQYAARNFVIQAAASNVCLEKLVALTDRCCTENYKVAFTVHDGYGMICHHQYAKELLENVREVFSEESKLCPGLKLDLHFKFGKKLDEMKNLK